MANNELNRLSPSESDIYSKLLVLASKYAGGEDVDFIRSGVFGYVTDYRKYNN